MQDGALQHGRDRGAQLRRRDRLAVEEHLSARCRLEAGERPQQRRLPRTVRTEHGHRLAVGDLQEVHREQVTATVRDPQVPAADAHHDEDRAGEAAPVRRSLRAPALRLLALLGEGDEEVDREGDGQQHETERDGQGELAAAGREHRGGGEHPRLALDVPADHLRGAHLAHDRTEAGQAGREQRQPGLGEQRRRSPASGSRPARASAAGSPGRPAGAPRPSARRRSGWRSRPGR